MLISVNPSLSYLHLSEDALKELNPALTPEAGLELIRRRILPCLTQTGPKEKEISSRSLKQAFLRLRKYCAVSRGITPVLMLGQFYEYGIGCRVNKAMALRLYRSRPCPLSQALCEGLLLRNHDLDPRAGIAVWRRFKEHVSELSAEEKLQYLLYVEEYFFAPGDLQQYHRDEERTKIRDFIDSLLKQRFQPAYACCYALLRGFPEDLGKRFNENFFRSASLYSASGHYYLSLHRLEEAQAAEKHRQSQLMDQALVNFMNAVALKERRACMHFFILCCSNLRDPTVKMALQRRLWTLVSEQLLPEPMLRDILIHAGFSYVHDHHSFSDPVWVTRSLFQAVEDITPLENFTWDRFEIPAAFAELSRLFAPWHQDLLTLGLNQSPWFRSARERRIIARIMEEEYREAASLVARLEDPDYDVDDDEDLEDEDDHENAEETVCAEQQAEGPAVPCRLNLRVPGVPAPAGEDTPAVNDEAAAEPEEDQRLEIVIDPETAAGAAVSPELPDRAAPLSESALTTLLGFKPEVLSARLQSKAEFARGQQDELVRFCRRRIITSLKVFAKGEDGSLFRPGSLGPYLILNAPKGAPQILRDLAAYLGCHFKYEQVTGGSGRVFIPYCQETFRKVKGIVVIGRIDRLTALEERRDADEKSRSCTYEARGDSFEQILTEYAREGNLVFCLSESTAVGDLIEDRDVFEETLVLPKTQSQHSLSGVLRALPAAPGVPLEQYLSLLQNSSEYKVNRFVSLLRQEALCSGSSRLECRHFERALSRLNSLSPNLFRPGVFTESFRITGNRGLTEFLNEKILSCFTRGDKNQLSFPESFLLYGVPGTGKTQAMERLSAHLGFEIFRVDSSTVYSSFIHDTSMKIRRIFEDARKHAPSMLLIDEVDAFMGDRSNMDRDFEVEEISEFLRLVQHAREQLVLIVGTTNRIEAIDPAILRPGRIGLCYEVRPCTREDVCDLITERLTLHRLPVREELLSVCGRLAGLTVAELDRRLELSFEHTAGLKGSARLERLGEELLKTGSPAAEPAGRRIGFI